MGRAVNGALDPMGASSSDVVFGGEVAIAGVLFIAGTVQVADAFLTSRGIERVVVLVVGLWMMLVGHEFPTRSIKWHWAALGTVAIIGALNLLALVAGVISFFTLSGGFPGIDWSPISRAHIGAKAPIEWCLTTRFSDVRCQPTDLLGKLSFR